MNIGKLFKGAVTSIRGGEDISALKDMAQEFLSGFGIESEGGEPITEAQVIPTLEQMVQPGRLYFTATLKFKKGGKAQIFVAAEKGDKDGAVS